MTDHAPLTDEELVTLTETIVIPTSRQEQFFERLLAAAQEAGGSLIGGESRLFRTATDASPLAPLTDEELAEYEQRQHLWAWQAERLIADLRASRDEVERLRQMESTIGFNARDPLGQRVYALQNELAATRARAEAAEASLQRLVRLADELRGRTEQEGTHGG